MKNYKAYLEHILDEADYLMRSSAGMEYSVFIEDETLKRSFVRSLEVIGEAVKNLPRDFKEAHGEVEWKKVAGMRDILIHHYFGVDYKMVWDVVMNQVPDLKEKIKKAL